MSIDFNELATWFTERPKWLQDAARRLFQAGDLTEADLDDLVILCKREAGVTVSDKPELIPVPITASALNVTGVGVPLRLDVLSEIKGINALAPRNPLQLGTENLAIIYGTNGAGKSGYIRILKHVCGGRGLRTLHRNVFHPSQDDQGCKVSYTHNGNPRSLQWKPEDGSFPDLRSISLFDSDCANIYISNENEVAYEPVLLCYFRRLVEVCEQVHAALKNEIDGKKSTKPALPSEHSLSPAGKWYAGLTHTTSDALVEQHCKWNPELETEYSTTEQRLKEANPTERAKALRKAKGHVQELRIQLEDLRKLIDDSAVLTLFNARRDVATKRRAADDAATKIFEKAPLTGVASPTWQLLWEKAVVYSETAAYPGKPFPVTENDALCVLCQQPLTADAATRLKNFQSFITGSLETDAKAAETALNTLLTGIKEVPSAESIDEKLDAANIVDEALRSLVQDEVKHLKTRRDAVLAAKGVTDNIDALPTNVVNQSLLDIEAKHETAAVTFDEDAKNDNKKELSDKARDLRAQKWLSEQSDAVIAEINRLKELAVLEKAQRLTNTQALSLKKTSLAELIITAAFIKRFEEELKELGGVHLKVTIEKTRTTKGQVWHRVALKENNLDMMTAEVLSEGELRVVSIAAFLADVAINQDNAAFIFDDPISSLDQDYEEKTAYRLAKMSKTRQVIVFTHRLSLLHLLESAAKKASVAFRIVSLSRQPWGAGEPGEVPLTVQNPTKALNLLINERLPKARKVFEQHGTQEYQPLAKALCSDFRIIVERMIENDLLADVVQRFRRPINTMGKIQNLAKISTADCKYMDDIMTKYSRYEHAQPDEAPVPLPEPPELDTDLRGLKSWQDAFNVRPVPPLA